MSMELLSMTEESPMSWTIIRSEEHTSELQSRLHLVCRLLLEKKKNRTDRDPKVEPARRDQPRHRLLEEALVPEATGSSTQGEAPSMPAPVGSDEPVCVHPEPT